MMRNKSEDAVSPVIGVMLMIVITVVIAGVIAAFGTGMVGNTETAPSVVLDVKIINFDRVLDGAEHGNLKGPDFRITHLSGDTLDTGDIEMRFSWDCGDDACTVASGGKHHSTYSADAISGIQPMVLELAGAPHYTVEGRTVEGIQYGDAELEPGYVINTLTKFLGDVTGDNGQHVGNPYMDQIFNNGRILTKNSLEDKGIMKCLDKGTKVDVSILHIPSNSIIYDKAVSVI